MVDQGLSSNVSFPFGLEGPYRHWCVLWQEVHSKQELPKYLKKKIDYEHEFLLVHLVQPNLQD